MCSTIPKVKMNWHVKVSETYMIRNDRRMQTIFQLFVNFNISKKVSSNAKTIQRQVFFENEIPEYGRIADDSA